MARGFLRSFVLGDDVFEAIRIGFDDGIEIIEVEPSALGSRVQVGRRCARAYMTQGT